MKNIIIHLFVFTLLLIPLNASAGDSISHSQKALTHSGNAIKNSGQAIGHAVAGSVQVTAGSVAVPFKVIGASGKAVGQACEQIGDDLWKASQGAPFEVSEKHIIKADPPPRVAIQKQEEQK
jgi:hypothetical protein